MKLPHIEALNRQPSVANDQQTAIIGNLITVDYELSCELSFSALLPDRWRIPFFKIPVVADGAV